MEVQELHSPAGIAPELKNVQRLIDSLQDAAKLLLDLREERFAFLTHYDADGLSSGGIMLRSAVRMNMDFCFRITADLTGQDFQDFLRTSADVYLFTDLGTGHMDAVDAGIPDGKTALILDHHQLQHPPPERDEIVLVNPELHDIDGGRDGCAAVLAALLAFFMTDDNDSYPLRLGVVGMVADMQKADDGVNRFLLDLAEKDGTVKRRTDFAFFRLANAPIHKALCWTDTPYIPDLSGREDTAVSLLSSQGISLRDGNRWRTVSELTQEEKEQIVRVVVEHTASKGAKIRSSDFMETTYVFPDEAESSLAVAHEFGSLLNACGRMRRAELGLLLAAGSRGEVLLEVSKLVEEKRAKVAAQLEEARKSFYVREGVMVVDGRRFIDENFAGTVSTVLSKSPVHHGQVILIFTDTADGGLKVSSRAPVPLTDQGFNLGRILSKVATKLGGEGGGHKMAAGATIPSENAETAIEQITQVCVEELARIEAQNAG